MTEKNKTTQNMRAFFRSPWLMKIISIALPVLSVLWIASALWTPLQSRETGVRSDDMPDCDIQHTACTRSLPGSSVTLDIHPKPVRAMRDLVFTLTITGNPPRENPFIDLNMPDMDMGFNRVYMTPVAPGLYEGRGVIVRCPSGIPVWRATAVLPGLGETEYCFDVIY
ncbi:hypothetical protein DENIS_0685 [Desulfonema ishimotonii]|uniref:YtkA-like domain-containing protein n=1 Tax=Desulfonema ishimotonii TaxID=45657 RepID=A0A401FS07_9BACT|nr:hypothetical protein [Desulfonema ishimotonii]GBC59744.1 hypothetical protein DENIS_0685 [Desulfonema ishimotonii]